MKCIDCKNYEDDICIVLTQECGEDVVCDPYTDKICEHFKPIDQDELEEEDDFLESDEDYDADDYIDDECEDLEDDM